MTLSPGGLSVAALSTWVATAAFGGNLLIRGRAYLLWPRLWRRQQPKARALLMTAHVLLAIGGLAIWLGYLTLHRDIFLDVAALVLGCVAVIGLSVVDRWRHAPGRHSARVPAESRFPVWSATVHVMAGTATVVLVVLVLVAGLPG